MAHELRYPRRQPPDECGEFRRAEPPGHLEPREIIRGPAAMPCERPAEGAACRSKEHTQQARRAEIEWPSHPGNSELLGDPRHSLQDLRQQMGVLMGVQVRRQNAGVEHAPNLRRQFVIRFECARGRPLESKRLSVSGSGPPKIALNQHEVASQVELRILTGQADGVVERAPVRHQRRGGEYSVAVRLDNSGIHIAREAEVIGVDEKTPRCCHRPKRSRTSPLRTSWDSRGCP